MKLLHEPLFQFLLGGVALFLLHSWATGGESAEPDRIVVSETRVVSLVRNFQRTWMRPPTRDEVDALVDDFVTEEVLYREAMALGLDRDDLIVRRRMRQKMEFLSDGIAEREPTDAELAEFLAANPERFEVPARLRFSQVFFAAGPEQDARASDGLARLAAGELPQDLGDATLLPRQMRAATPDDVAGTFGSDFAKTLAWLPVGEWTGPVPSGFGAHLVRVDESEPARTPALQEVRPAVEREWSSDRRQETRAQFLEAARQRYRVEVMMPDVSAPNTAPE